MERCDVAVVGSGLLGALVARRLAAGGQRVVVVERGEPASSPRGSHLRNLPDAREDRDGWFPIVDRHVAYLDSRAPDEALPGAFLSRPFGGMGVLWTNNAPRSVAGVDRPDLFDDSEWDRLYSEAEADLQVSDDQFLDSLRSRIVEERLGRVLARAGRHLVPLPLSGHRLDARTIAYVGPADVLDSGTGPIQIRRGRVEQVLFDGRRAVGVRVDGERIDAEAVVVAAGAIETPLLLRGSGVDVSALGRCLSFHPVLIGQVVLDDGSAPAPDPLPRIGIPPTPDHPWFVMALRDTNPLQPTAPDLDVPEAALLELQAFVPVDPHPQNRVLVDAGVPRLQVPLREPDLARLRLVEDDVRELAAELGRFRAGCTPAWAPFGTPHLMGSCRMGALDDGLSVVDTEGAVWGTEQLYVVGNAVIPTRLAVNPTLTAAALAIRTTDRLLTDR